MRWGLLVGAGVFLLVAARSAGQSPPTEAAIAAIRQLGGEVRVAADQSGSPITVVLTGSKQPGQCVSLLKDVANLRQCDL